MHGHRQQRLAIDEIIVITAGALETVRRAKRSILAIEDRDVGDGTTLLEHERRT